MRIISFFLSLKGNRESTEMDGTGEAGVRLRRDGGAQVEVWRTTGGERYEMGGMRNYLRS